MRSGSYDLAGLAGGEGAVDFAPVFIGRDPHWEQDVLEADELKLTVGTDFTLSITRNVVHAA